MTRWLLWSLAGILVGVMAHLLSLIALPALASRTGFLRAAAIAPTGHFAVLPGEDSPLPLADPSLLTALCRYDLGSGPLHVRVPVSAGFLSVSFYTPASLNYYALTDRAAANGALDLTLYTESQLADIRARQGPDLPGALRITAPQADGLVMLRALIPEPGMKSEVAEILSGAVCEQAP